MLYINLYKITSTGIWKVGELPIDNSFYYFISYNSLDTLVSL